MARTISVLLIVDTVATVNGATTVYMVDDNPADTAQGGNELNINCEIGDTIIWNVASIIPSWGCVLTEFVKTEGDNLFSLGPGFSNGVWTGVVGRKGSETYHFNFTVNGDSGTYNWDPYITVK